VLKVTLQFLRLLLQKKLGEQDIVVAPPIILLGLLPGSSAYDKQCQSTERKGQQMAVGKRLCKTRHANKPVG